MAGGVAHVKGLDGCMECGYCWYLCPVDAIDFVLPPGGTGYHTKWG
jgi:ferredoxin-like protein FixX